MTIGSSGRRGRARPTGALRLVDTGAAACCVAQPPRSSWAGLRPQWEWRARGNGSRRTSPRPCAFPGVGQRRRNASATGCRCPRRPGQRRARNSRAGHATRSRGQPWSRRDPHGPAQRALVGTGDRRGAPADRARLQGTRGERGEMPVAAAGGGQRTQRLLPRPPVKQPPIRRIRPRRGAPAGRSPSTAGTPARPATTRETRGRGEPVARRASPRCAAATGAGDSGAAGGDASIPRTTRRVTLTEKPRPGRES